METKQLTIRNGDRLVVDLTSEVASFCEGRGDGLCHLFAPHATAGLALMEIGSGSEQDLAAALERLLPRDERYRHRHGAPGHGADHLLPVLVAPFLVLAVQAGEVVLGTCQSIVLIDTNADNPERHVLLSFLAERA